MRFLNANPNWKLAAFCFLLWMLIANGEMSVHLIKNELVDIELIFWRRTAADHLHRRARQQLCEKSSSIE